MIHHWLYFFDAVHLYDCKKLFSNHSSFCNYPKPVHKFAQTLISCITSSQNSLYLTQSGVKYLGKKWLIKDNLKVAAEGVEVVEVAVMVVVAVVVLVLVMVSLWPWS